MKKVIAAMIGIAFAFCCFMLYEGQSANTTDVVENTTNEMYHPSNEELIEACIENSYPDVEYDEMRIVSTPEENDGYLTYVLIKGEHVVGFETIGYEYGAQVYFN